MSDFISTVTDEMVQRGLDALSTVGTSAAHAAAEALARAVSGRIAGQGGGGAAEASADGAPSPERLRELVRAVLTEQPELRQALALAPSQVNVSVRGNGNLAAGVVHGDIRVRGWKFWNRRG